MGKRSKEVTISTILLLLSIACIYFSYLIHEKINLHNSDVKAEEKSLKEKEKELDLSKNEVNQLDKDIDFYQNIDQKIQELKDNYFRQIKELEEKIKKGETNRKIAYLTFDDGPYYNTYKVLDILDQYDVKATFFTISMNGEYCYDNKSERCYPLYKEYVRRGHTIANHTYTHGIRTGLYSSVNAFMDAINKQEEHVKTQTDGYITNIVRFPGGSSTARGLKAPIIEALKNKGYGWVDWNAGDGDGGRLDSEAQAWNNLYATINEDIEVILFHDYSRITTSILPDVITYLKNKGYEIYPLFYDSVMINK